MGRSWWVVGLVLLSACGEPTVAEYEAQYEARWGAVDLTGWKVTVVDVAPVVDGQRRAGETDWQTQTVVIWRPTLYNTAHELHHVALGPSSYDHHGWCDFGRWERELLGFDEMAYLGCPP